MLLQNRAIFGLRYAIYERIAEMDKPRKS